MFVSLRQKIIFSVKVPKTSFESSVNCARFVERAVRDPNAAF